MNHITLLAGTTFLVACSSHTETNMPHEEMHADASLLLKDGAIERTILEKPDSSFLDASLDAVEDSEDTPDECTSDEAIDTIDASLDGNEENPSDVAGDEPIEAVNPPEDAHGSEDSPLDTFHETATDGTIDASVDADAANLPLDAAVDGSNDADAGKRCQLQGLFPCWPMVDHPTFDIITPNYVVQDRVTGLQWEADTTSASTYYTFDDAARACRNKGLPVPPGVTAKWRMPTLFELVSILDYSIGAPVFDTSVLAATSEQFWTSSETANHTSGFTVTMYQGAIATKPKTQSYYGRCVLDPFGDLYDESTSLHFDSSVPGQFRDMATGLTWEVGDTQNSSARSVTSAQNYCNGKSWRLPTLKELLTLLDPALINAPLVPAAVNSSLLPEARGGYYWSDSAAYDGGMTAQHWALHFLTGSTSNQETAAYVRCVR